jgi:hypothetical protein
VPAAAVIPAPIAYINVVAVKKLVVGFWDGLTRPPNGVYALGHSSFWRPVLYLTVRGRNSGLLL